MCRVLVRFSTTVLNQHLFDAKDHRDLLQIISSGNMSHLLTNFSLPLMGVYIVFYLLIYQLHDSALRIFYTLTLKVPSKHPYMQNQMKLEMEVKIVFGSVCVSLCFFFCFFWRCMVTTAFSRRVLKGLQLYGLQHLRGEKIEHHKKKITLLARCS